MPTSDVHRKEIEEKTIVIQNNSPHRTGIPVFLLKVSCLYK